MITVLSTDTGTSEVTVSVVSDFQDLPCVSEMT